jgi:hypothetical protein
MSNMCLMCLTNKKSVYKLSQPLNLTQGDFTYFFCFFNVKGTLHHLFFRTLTERPTLSAASSPKNSFHLPFF